MLRKFVFCITLLALICLISSQSITNQASRKIITIPPRVNQGNNSLSPGLRKCQNIKCQQGQYCFHGRCKEIDYECVNIKCQDGFRCSNGSCLQQKHKPQKQICKPLGFNQIKINCDVNMQKKCKTEQSNINVCGYTKDGTTKDFSNECSACADSSIKFIYQLSCSLSPIVCHQSHQCFNGICKEMFTESVFQHSVTCNKNSDCELNEHCAGHKCLDKRDLFNYMHSMAENTPISIAI